MEVRLIWNEAFQTLKEGEARRGVRWRDKNHQQQRVRNAFGGRMAGLCCPGLCGAQQEASGCWSVRLFGGLAGLVEDGLTSGEHLGLGTSPSHGTRPTAVPGHFVPAS